MSEESESRSGEDPTDYGADGWEDPVTGAVPKSELPDEIVEEVPHWTEDPYFDRVSDRLMYNYTLERDHRLRGERWDLYGEMRVLNQKQFFHPALSFAHHESYEHLFVRRVDRVDTGTVGDLVALGHDLADDRVDPHEEHYSTEFTFALVAPAIPDAVREQVAGLDERTLLKYGFNGHYEVNVVVVAPSREEIVANEAADVTEAFTTWESIEREEPGLLGLLARRFQL